MLTVEAQRTRRPGVSAWELIVMMMLYRTWKAEISVPR